MPFAIYLLLINLIAIQWPMFCVGLWYITSLLYCGNSLAINDGVASIVEDLQLDVLDKAAQRAEASGAVLPTTGVFSQIRSELCLISESVAKLAVTIQQQLDHLFERCHKFRYVNLEYQTKEARGAGYIKVVDVRAVEISENSNNIVLITKQKRYGLTTIYKRFQHCVMIYYRLIATKLNSMAMTPINEDEVYDFEESLPQMDYISGLDPIRMEFNNTVRAAYDEAIRALNKHQGLSLKNRGALHDLLVYTYLQTRALIILIDAIYPIYDSIEFGYDQMLREYVKANNDLPFGERYPFNESLIRDLFYKEHKFDWLKEPMEVVSNLRNLLVEYNRM